ncbi:MAG: FAD-binding oxidoreductase, partial [Candidatus Hodarchaeales archaeon]
MKESLSKKELRELTLWGSEEPEEFSEDFIERVKEILPGWEPSGITKDELDEKISIPDPDLPGGFVNEITDVVGTENVDFSAKSRVLYSHGGSSEDLLRIRAGNFSKLTEAVIHPQSEEQIIEILRICEKYKIAVIPVGGRTSVTRALTLTKKGIALDLYPHMVKISSINKNNRTVTTQAGIFGPVLESALNEKGFTLGHFPQSFEQCSVGGWIAARSAGQNSTLYGKIEDIVLSLRIVTSKGVFESPRVPAHATGPHWLPYFIGSEGTLGIITQATLKIHPVPEKREFASYLFPSFEHGVRCLKKICQSGFLPSI